MKRFSSPALAVTACMLALAPLASAQMPACQPPVHGQREAMKMVPARVELKDMLDAKKTMSGTTFRATLVSKVKLDNGMELPAGTVLTGNVADDDMSVEGPTKMALRFTSLTLKNGQSMPIRATIIDAQKPQQNLNTVDESDDAARAATIKWTPDTLKVDQIDVGNGVDMHSAIASKNSGVFVSTKGKDVKLAAGSQFSIALAPQMGQ